MTDEVAAEPVGVAGKATKFSKDWREPLQFVAALVAVVTGMKGVVLPKAQEYLGVTGPALIVRSLDMTSARPGTRGVMRWEVDKIRNCKLSSAAITLTDSKGREFPIEHGWTMTLPARPNQHPTFDYEIPKAASPGPASVNAFISHEACTDGGKSPTPVSSSIRVVIEP